MANIICPSDRRLQLLIVLGNKRAEIKVEGESVRTSQGGSKRKGERRKESEMESECVEERGREEDK